jgi:HSP20 family protein
MLFTDFYQNPFAEIRRLQQEMNHLFQDFDPRKIPTEFPAINLWSKGEEAIVAAEVPGVSPEKISLQVKDNVLTIEGIREQDCKYDSPENVCYHRQERSAGAFKRMVRLPFKINSQDVNAEYKKGILTVRLRRAEEDKPRKIEIKS